MSKTDSYSHVLILGCGRSGTSIFGELFESVPGYTYHSEPEFGHLAELSFQTPVAVKVPKESEGYPATPGLSFPLDVMLSVIPKPCKIYWQVRHPLDAIASLRPGISNNWGHHPRPPDWQDWVDRPLVEQCAHHWNYINTIGFQQVKHLVAICRFESMINDPASFAHNICRDIGCDPDECTASLQAWADRVQDTNNDKFVEARTSRRYSRLDHKNRIGRWRENLNAEDLSQIVPIVREAASAFGYELPVPSHLEMQDHDGKEPE